MRWLGNFYVTAVAALVASPARSMIYDQASPNYEAKIAGVKTKLDAYNTLLSQADRVSDELDGLEKELADLNERMLTGVATQFGKIAQSTKRRAARARASARSRSPNLQRRHKPPFHTPGESKMTRPFFLASTTFHFSG